MDHITVIIEGTRLARHFGSIKSKYLMGCNPGISILIGLGMVARHIDTIGNDTISSSEKHQEKTDEEWRNKTLTNYFLLKKSSEAVPIRKVSSK